MQLGVPCAETLGWGTQVPRDGSRRIPGVVRTFTRWRVRSTVITCFELCVAAAQQIVVLLCLCFVYS